MLYYLIQKVAKTYFRKKERIKKHGDNNTQDRLYKVENVIYTKKWREDR